MDLSRKMFTSFGVKSEEGACMSPPFPYIASAVRGSIRKPSPRDPSATPGCPHELPKHLSHQWASPRQGWHKVYGNSRHGMWPAKHFWDVCWGLGLHRWRRLVLRISKEKKTVESVRSPQRSWRFLGMNLELARKKDTRQTLPFVT